MRAAYPSPLVISNADHIAPGVCLVNALGDLQSFVINAADLVFTKQGQLVVGGAPAVYRLSDLIPDISYPANRVSIADLLPLAEDAILRPGVEADLNTHHDGSFVIPYNLQVNEATPGYNNASITSSQAPAYGFSNALDAVNTASSYAFLPVGGQLARRFNFALSQYRPQGVNNPSNWVSSVGADFTAITSCTAAALAVTQLGLRIPGFNPQVVQRFEEDLWICFNAPELPVINTYLINSSNLGCNTIQTVGTPVLNHLVMIPLSTLISGKKSINTAFGATNQYIPTADPAIPLDQANVSHDVTLIASS
jgi:hypothetical protein